MNQRRELPRPLLSGTTLRGTVWKPPPPMISRPDLLRLFSHSINVCSLSLPGIFLWAGPLTPVHKVCRKQGGPGDSHSHGGSLASPNRLPCCAWPCGTLTIAMATANNPWRMQAKGSHGTLTDGPGGAGVIRTLTQFIPAMETLCRMRWRVTQSHKGETNGVFWWQAFT